MKRKPYIKVLDLVLMFSLAVFVLLEAMVLPQSYATVATASETQDSTSSVSEASAEASVTETSYSDENISITISTVRYLETDVYIADIQVSDISYLKAAFANDTYGKNVTASTSSIASSHDAILAINGDFYGARNAGYVLRNGTLYRSASRSSSQEDLAILEDGSFEIFTEGSVSAESLEEEAWQVFSFGPALIDDGEIVVGEVDEVGQSMASNPRTVICEIDQGHYLFVVADGRTSESAGLTLYEMAQLLTQYDVKVAYNLDGGGSSTMVFNGTVINRPTTNGRTIKERSVSDIVYIGY